MKKIICSAIVFTEDTIDSMLAFKENDYYKLPYKELEENETLLECVRKAVACKFEINIEGIVLAYIIKNDDYDDYVFVAQTQEKINNDNYILKTSNIENYKLNPDILKNDLIDKFAHGFCLNETRQLINVTNLDD